MDKRKYYTDVRDTSIGEFDIGGWGAMQQLTMLTVLYFVGGLGLVAISVPLIRRWIKPNYIYGVRLRKTLENPDLWYAANAYFGVRTAVTGMVIALTAVIVRLLPGVTLDGYATLCTLVILSALVITMVLTLRYISAWHA
jgi:hypothetical protein